MKLYLLRHAEAEDVASSDFERVLTAKGRDQSERVARFCKKNQTCPELIVHSPYLRAAETARIVGKTLDVPSSVSNALGCGMNPETALAELRSFDRFDSVMFVGHEPDLSTLAGYLLGAGRGQPVHMRKATLVCIRMPLLRPGEGVMEFMLPAKFM